MSSPRHFRLLPATVKRQLAWWVTVQSRAGIIAPTLSPGRPQMAKEMKEFAGLFYREGALDPKTMSLVALAAMAAAGCTS